MVFLTGLWLRRKARAVRFVVCQCRHRVGATSELVSLSETYQNVRMKGNAYAQVKSIDALRRGLEVLVAIERSAAVSLADLHRQTDIPKATLLRVLRTLQEAGWVERNELEGRYIRTSSPGESGQLAEWRARLSSLAAPPREWLQKRVPWPADLAVRDGSDAAFNGLSLS